MPSDLKNSARVKTSHYIKNPKGKQKFRVWEEENQNMVVIKEKTHSLNFVLFPQSLECFFLEVDTGSIANIEYSVRSVNINDGSYSYLTAIIYGEHGAQLDRFESLRNGFFEYESHSEHDLKICFSNNGKGSRLVVLLDVLTLKQKVEPMREINFGAKSLEKIVFNLFRTEHQIFLLKVRRTVDFERLQAITHMIDYRSCLYITMVAIVGVIQVTLHRRFFSKASNVRV
nr:uncharacterized protein LOC121129644 [Lepeophtheirus salmonis]